MDDTQAVTTGEAPNPPPQAVTMGETPKPARWARFAQMAQAAVAVLATAAASAGGLWQLSILTRLWLGRARYPWDIEWLESAALYQAYRVMRGLSTYGPPRDGYIPLMHPPFYPAALGVIGKVIGLDYGMARTISFLCFCLSAGLSVRAVLRHARRDAEERPGSPGRATTILRRGQGWALGLFGAGCAAAAAPVFECFYDLVREDVMAIALSVIMAVLVDTQPRLRPRRIALLAVVITTLVYTRLPAVFFPVVIVLYAYFRHPRSGVMLALTSIAGGGLVLVALQATSRGWYWMLTVSLLQGQAITGPRFLLGLQIVGKFAPFVVGLPVLAAVLAAARRLSSSSMLWLGMLLASVPASLLPFAKVGGFANDFMPVMFFIGPATAFLVLDLVAAFSSRPRLQLGVYALLCAAGGAFLFHRTWDIKPFVPSADLFKRARALDTRVSALQGGIVSPRHPFLPIHDGDTAQGWADMPYLDMAWSGYGDLDLGGYIDRNHPKWAVVNGTETLITTRELSTRFQLEERLPDPPVTITGERSSTRYLLRIADDEKNARVLFDFESTEGWTMTGSFHIATARPPGQYPIAGAVGKHLADSYDPVLKDPAKGTMISPRFTIDRPHLAFRLGGGWHSGTRIELRVNGRIEKSATGMWEYQETLMRQVWDVSRLQGKEAQIYLIDEDAGVWGHLVCDHIVLY
jgi:hypothetical protein